MYESLVLFGQEFQVINLLSEVRLHALNDFSMLVMVDTSNFKFAYK
jgi:hypothetical protein